ncbi:hypothetical protein OBBRIDRAFT_648827 [Obba rivulosa]|uniref:Uncharacterized protein n=1 Tax=Obba rivulosa TaxID=1052685 RepID=A0A8E2ARS0_9APHY|nr:hypothetical protein OBBRIDRAFT_648827 [Obba rivulosa]
MSLVLHELTSYSENLFVMLPRIISLSNAIFSAEPGSKHASLALWQERLSYTSSVIVYLVPESSPNDPVAFMFAYPRSHSIPLSGGEHESLHIWLAGVLPGMRRAGCLSRMIHELDLTPLLTVCTIPQRFPDMWRWLTSRGWVVIRDLGEGKVMLERRTPAHPLH